MGYDLLQSPSDLFSQPQSVKPPLPMPCIVSLHTAEQIGDAVKGQPDGDLVWKLLGQVNPEPFDKSFLAAGACREIVRTEPKERFDAHPMEHILQINDRGQPPVGVHEPVAWREVIVRRDRTLPGKSIGQRTYHSNQFPLGGGQNVELSRLPLGIIEQPVEQRRRVSVSPQKQTLFGRQGQAIVTYGAAEPGTRSRA